MEILDKHFIALPNGRKIFVVVIGAGFLLVALIAHIYNLTNIIESMLILIIGILYAELIKLHYRIDSLEKKK